jgi:glycosyltransferase involved in cell wall biosynthesis
MIMAYTATGAADLEAALRATQESAQTLPPVFVIPHAIDRLPFSLPADRPNLRAALFPEHAHRAEGVWLLNANRNDYRKRPELTMAAFALVAKDLPQATLVLHCSPDRPGLDLRAERDRLGLGDNVVFTQDTYPGPLTERQLADLYACCDIGINTALAEGWGLIAFEHALCGAAQILPAHKGLQEIWGGAPLWIPVGEKTAIDDVFSGQAPGTAALSAAVRYLVVDAAARQQVAGACAARASDYRFEWERVGAMWRKMVAGAITAQRAGEAERLISLWISA